MNLIFERRAEIALRSLRGADRKEVARAIHMLESIPKYELFNHHSIHKGLFGSDSTALYILDAGMRLRLVLSIEGEACIVLDIADYNRLGRLLLKERSR